MLVHDVTLTQWGVVIGASLVGGLIDLRQGRIPNLLTLPLAIGGMAWMTIGGGWGGLASSLGGLALLLLPFFLLFLFAGGGAGDAKLMGGIGAWLGPGPGLAVLVAVILAGGLLGLAVAVRRGRLGLMLANVGRVTRAMYMILATRRLMGTWMQYAPDPATKMTPMRYGPAIFIGVLAVAILNGLQGTQG